MKFIQRAWREARYEVVSMGCYVTAAALLVFAAFGNFFGTQPGLSAFQIITAGLLAFNAGLQACNMRNRLYPRKTPPSNSL